MIKIVDNFFENILFKNIKNHITTKISYTPRHFTDTKEKNEKNYYGSRFKLIDDKNLLNTFAQQIEKKFNIKLISVGKDSGIDIRNLNHFKPHVDTKNGKINVLIMLKGPRAVTNGTVFYTDGELDIHIGFKENRAILFPSDWYHSPHKSEVANLKRYTASIFIKNYEE